MLRTFDFFREDGEYFMAKDGHMLYRDNNHLNIHGSYYVAERLRETGQLEAFADASGVGGGRAITATRRTRATGRRQPVT